MAQADGEDLGSLQLLFYSKKENKKNPECCGTGEGCWVALAEGVRAELQRTHLKVAVSAERRRCRKNNRSEFLMARRKKSTEQTQGTLGARAQVI